MTNKMKIMKMIKTIKTIKLIKMEVKTVNEYRFRMYKRKMYKDYFEYIMEHKKNVFKVCWGRKMYLHALTHDLSKLLPSEFFPYADWFYGEYGVKIEKQYPDKENYTNGQSCLSRSYLRCRIDFKYAWAKHYKRNKHHWEHWYNPITQECRYMPQKYIKQMICDWDAMALKFGDTSREFYMYNYDKIQLNLKSRVELEFELGLIDEACLISNITWKDYCERNNITMKEDLRRIKMQ